MTCPTNEEWTMASMDLLDAERTAWLREHLQTCEACQERFHEDRRIHFGLLRAYETMDRDHDALREQLLATLSAGAPQPGSTGWVSRGWRRLGDLTMNYPKTRRAAGILSAAAVIALAVSAFVSSGNGMAFADVKQHLREIKTTVCRMITNTTVGEQVIKLEGKMYMSSEYGTRCNFEIFGQPSATLFKPPQDPAILITPMMKSYMIIEEQEEDDDTFDHMRAPDAFLKKLMDLTEDATELLGPEQIDGHDVVGFEVAPEQLELGNVETSAQLYVDAKTALPVKFAIEMPGPEPGGRIKVVYDEFEWNTPLDVTLFEPVIPDDYTEVNLRLPAATEETLIKALRTFAQLTGGSYPEEFDAVRLPTEMARLAAEETLARGESPAPGSPAYETLSEKVMEAAQAFAFYQHLIRHGLEPEYFGAEVTAQDADAVLMQWHVDDRQLRVIYGDLTVETVPDRP